MPIFSSSVIEETLISLFRWWNVNIVKFVNVNILAIDKPLLIITRLNS